MDLFVAPAREFPTEGWAEFGVVMTIWFICLWLAVGLGAAAAVLASVRAWRWCCRID